MCKRWADFQTVNPLIASFKDSRIQTDGWIFKSALSTKLYLFIKEIENSGAMCFWRFLNFFLELELYVKDNFGDIEPEKLPTKFCKLAT